MVSLSQVQDQTILWFFDAMMLRFVVRSNLVVGDEFVQMFESDTKRPFSPLLMSTYSPEEGGVTFEYKVVSATLSVGFWFFCQNGELTPPLYALQIEFTVSAKVDQMTPKQQKNLITFVKGTLGTFSRGFANTPSYTNIKTSSLDLQNTTH